MPQSLFFCLFSCLFFSRSFIVASCTFRSLIHLEFIFVYGVKECSNFILRTVCSYLRLTHYVRTGYHPHLQNQLHNLGGPVQNKNTGSLIQKLLKI